MKRLNGLGLAFVLSLISAAAKAENLAAYASTCAQKLGVTSIPGYSCSSGTTVSGADFTLTSFNNRVGRVPTSNPNVDAVYLCRDFNSGTNRANLNGYILQNSINGDTCFFDAIMDGTATVPSPNASNATSYWTQPQGMAGNCSHCHSADPFIATKGLAAGLKTQGMIRSGRNLKGVYNIVNSEVASSHFFNWNAQRQIVTSSCASNCHNTSSNPTPQGIAATAASQNWMALPAYVPSTETPANIGVYRPSDGKFYLDRGGDHRWTSVDLIGLMGIPGDRPFVLRGTTCTDSSKQNAEIGIARGQGTWYTSKNNHYWDDPDVANTFYHGINSQPLSWNGVPVSFENGLFVVDVNNTRSEAGDLFFSFGQTGDRPAVGRWKRGIGHRVGIFRGVGSDGWFYLDTTGTNAWDAGDSAFQFGLAGDLPFAGDFNGDGVDEIGVFRDGNWFVDTNNNFRWDGTAAGDSWWIFGQTGDRPMVSPTTWDCAWIGVPP